MPRAGLGKPWSASNANKPASSWPLKQGPKKSKHAIKGQPDLGRTKRKRYELTFMFKLQGRKSACTTCAGSSEILRWADSIFGSKYGPQNEVQNWITFSFLLLGLAWAPFWDPDLDPKVGSAIGEFCCCPQRFCKQICDALA